MIKNLAVVFLLLIVFFISGCSGLKMEKEEPIVSSLAFTGKYKIESVKADTGKTEKYIGELNMLDGNGMIYVSGEEHSVSNPKKINKFKGKGKYDQKTKTVLFTFIVNEKEQLMGEYEKTDYGFEWFYDKDIKTPQSSHDKWIKIN